MANDRHSYVQFYPSDWVAGISFMPPMVEWLYLQICLYNWDKREAMPPAQTRLRLSRSPDWEADLAALIEAGKVIKTQSGGLFVERAMIEANRAFDLWERKSRGGKRSPNQTNAQESSKSDGKTLDKSGGGSLASNQNQNQNQNQNDSPNHIAQADFLERIDADAWRDFAEHRIKLKAPLTERAAKMIRTELHRLAEQGHDPNDVLGQSLMNGWKGVFPLKRGDNGKGKLSGWRFDHER